jgi:hypothetical protein
MRTQTITGAVRIALAILAIVAATAHGATPAAHDADDSRITVTDVTGSVDVTMAGQPVVVHADSTMLLPARIVTGLDGKLGMTQAGTSITVSSDTDVEIPAEAVDGNLVARLVQHRGNVFYDVAPRDLGKLRVETPFLVAVIKGTQFNVAVHADSTTISLFEGQLEILTPDGRDVIQLDAGEIAIRSLLDDAIRVIGMDDERIAAPPAPAARVADADDARMTPRTAVATATREAGANAGVAGKPSVAAAADATVGTIIDLSSAKDVTGPKAGVVVGTTADVRIPVDLGSADLNVGAGTSVDVAAGTSVDVDLDKNVDLHAAPLDARLDTDVGADLDLGGVVADLDTSLDLGATLDLGGALDLDIDLEVELDAGASPDADDPTTVPALPRLLLPGLPGRP